MPTPQRRDTHPGALEPPGLVGNERQEREND